MLLGETDVEGPGVVVTITPKVLNMDTSNKNVIITHKDLITYVNELNFAGAEAISINGYRITSNKGIRSSDGVKTIFIGNERIVIAKSMEFWERFKKSPKYVAKYNKTNNIIGPIPKF